MLVSGDPSGNYLGTPGRPLGVLWRPSGVPWGAFWASGVPRGSLGVPLGVPLEVPGPLPEVPGALPGRPGGHWRAPGVVWEVILRSPEHPRELQKPTRGGSWEHVGNVRPYFLKIAVSPRRNTNFQNLAIMEREVR